MSSKRKKTPSFSPQAIALIEQVVETLKEQMQATKTLYRRKRGVVTDVMEVPDHATQRRAAEELMKIMGLCL